VIHRKGSTQGQPGLTFVVVIAVILSDYSQRMLDCVFNRGMEKRLDFRVTRSQGRQKGPLVEISAEEVEKAFCSKRLEK